jgi:hypothetical protein
MAKHEIRAVELVRKIRDEHYVELQGKTIEERIAFYEEEARRFHTKMAKKVKISKKLPETTLAS